MNETNIAHCAQKPVSRTCHYTVTQSLPTVQEAHVVQGSFLISLSDGSDTDEDEREDPRDVAQLSRTWQSRQGK